MTTKQPREVATVRQLRATWRPGHAKALRCGRCRENLATTGLPDITYTFEVCTCSTATYDHLVEQLWHRECFVFEAITTGAPTGGSISWSVKEGKPTL